MSAQLRVSRLTARSDSSTIAFTMKVGALGTLDYIVLPCSDLEEMRQFYSHNLGLTATYERAGAGLSSSLAKSRWRSVSAPSRSSHALMPTS